VTKQHPKRIPLNHRQIAEILVVSLGIHEGLWRIYLGAGPVAGLMAKIDGLTRPSFLISVSEMGIMQVDTPEESSVDAAVVNPARSLALVQ